MAPVFVVVVVLVVVACFWGQIPRRSLFMLFYGKILLRAFRRRRNFRYFLPQLLARQHVHVSWRDQPLPDDDEHPPPCPPLVVGSGLEIQMMLRAAAFAAALTGLVRLVWKIRERKERSSTRAHFGDLMGDEPSDRVGATSVSSLPGENNKRRSEMAKLTEFERVVLTANGNLQRIISACFNEPVRLISEFKVTVEILQNEKQECDYKYFRKVKLRCGQRHFCTALSMVTINDKKMQNAVDQRKVGIGQLFRVFNILPKYTIDDLFRLLAFKKESSGAAFFKAQQQKEEEKEEETGKWGEGHRHLHLLRQAAAAAAAGESGQCEQKEEVLHREMIDFVSSSRAFWRLYRLEHRKFSCTLLEEFPDPSFFEQLSNDAGDGEWEPAADRLLAPQPACESIFEPYEQERCVGEIAHVIRIAEMQSLNANSGSLFRHSVMHGTSSKCTTRS
eukprot:jgi/Bigna1/80402/fgenesh1_pg.70_\